MSRRVKEFVDIKDHNSLDELIGKLIEVRDQLPENCEAELKLRGDDVFGHRLTITYFREQTAEEAEIEQRYADAEKTFGRALVQFRAGGDIDGEGTALEHRRMGHEPLQPDIGRDGTQCVAWMPCTEGADHADRQRRQGLEGGIREDHFPRLGRRA